jgi:hypothetical protein
LLVKTIPDPVRDFLAPAEGEDADQQCDRGGRDEWPVLRQERSDPDTTAEPSSARRIAGARISAKVMRP